MSEFKYKFLINGQMGLGYGSKYQLLRYLGWHRKELNQRIAEAILCNPNKIKWFDFGYVGKYNDKEILNVDFLDDENIKDDWKKQWPTTGTGVTWDAVAKCEDTYILIEAKAHVSEISDKKGCGASQPARGMIERCIKKHLPEIKDNENLFGLDYQLANRLMTVRFLESHGLKAKFVYLLFINGFEDNVERPDSASQEDWEEAVNKKIKRLGLKEANMDNLINVVYVDCKH